MSLHPELAAGRWWTLSLCEQFANVGSEVDRAIHASQEGRSERCAKAIDRALDLFDLTAQDERWRGHRRREILRAREEFVRLFFGDFPDPAAAQATQRYFFAFAKMQRAGGA